MINFAEIEIGGQRIDKHYGEWLHIWNQLTNQSGHEEAYQRMVGNTPHFTKNRSTIASTASVQNIQITGKRLYIPLQFWFCRNPGLALPLIALQYHEVKINIEFEELKKPLYSTKNRQKLSNRTRFSTKYIIMGRLHIP